MKSVAGARGEGRGGKGKGDNEGRTMHATRIRIRIRIQCKREEVVEFLEKLRSIYIYIYACMYVRMSVCIYRM